MSRGPSKQELQTLKDIANKLRLHSINSTNIAGTGHPTSCLSMADIMSVLFFHTMRYKLSSPNDPSNDRFVLSKGHAAPILYAAWAEAGLFSVDELQKLRKLESDLEGHPTPRLNFVDVATGSLGQGLSCAAGMAYVGKYLDKSNYRVYCLIGDGESAEGSIWEALAFSSKYKLDNLVAIFDINRLGQSEATAYAHDMETYRLRLEAFGFNTYVVDGHDVEALVKAFHDAATVTDKPTAIVAKTFKGKGISGVEDQDNFHGKALGNKSAPAMEEIRQRIVNNGPHGINPRAPTQTVAPIPKQTVQLSEPPNYKLGSKLATRAAYGSALTKLGKNNEHVIALDGDMKNSTFSIKFKEAFPDRFIECYIAEQNMVGVAIGAGCRNRTIPFVSTFACFLSRAYDQIRMAAVSQSKVNFVGSHCGVSIGADGPSQMALEDLAMFRAIPNCTVFYPSDGVSTERAVELAANTDDMTFIRVSRPDTPIIYTSDEEFAIGKAKVVRQSDSDQVTVIGAGVTLPEAVKAAEQLAENNINVRVIDPFTIKPIDRLTLVNAARSTGGRLVVVEDHYPEGGIGEAVAEALSEERDIVIKHLAVKEVPRSGGTAELLAKYNIDSTAVVNAVREVLKL